MVRTKDIFLRAASVYGALVNMDKAWSGSDILIIIIKESF